MKLYNLSKKELISLVSYLIQADEVLVKKVENLTNHVAELEVQVPYLKVKKDSNNSSTPPSQDQTIASKNKSLRKVTGKKRGRQTGHKGYTLEMSSRSDQVIKHTPDYCHQCGRGLERVSWQ